MRYLKEYQHQYRHRYEPIPTSRVIWNHRCMLLSSMITFVRKDIIPLIKQLHPDLLSHCSMEIKQQNMSCIQNLNDLWDTLECNIEQYNCRQSTSITLQRPFRDKYDLTCYLTPIIDDEGGNVKRYARLTKTRKKGDMIDANIMTVDTVDDSFDDRFKLPLQHIVPTCLCKKHIINEKLFQKSIESILLQQHELFNLAGLQSPWLFSDDESDADDVARTNNSVSTIYSLDQGGIRSSKNDDDNFSSAEISRIERMMFDRWIVKKGNYSNRGNFSSLDHIFNSPPPPSRQHQVVFASFYINDDGGSTFFTSKQLVNSMTIISPTSIYHGHKSYPTTSFLQLFSVVVITISSLDRAHPTMALLLVHTPSKTLICT